MAESTHLPTNEIKGSLPRALLLGVLAGATLSCGYLYLIIVHTIAGHSGYWADMGGTAYAVNGKPIVELPGKVMLAGIIAAPALGVLLGRVVRRSKRPRWWILALLMWLSFALSLVFLLLFGRFLGGLWATVNPFVGYMVFGALFGICLRSGTSALVLALSCAATYAVSVYFETLLPTHALVGWLTTATPDMVPYLHTHEAVHQTIIQTLHWSLVGGVIWFIERRTDTAA